MECIFLKTKSGTQSKRVLTKRNAGILYGIKVTKNALMNAVSVAAILLTTEAAVADIKEAVPAVPAQPEMY